MADQQATLPMRLREALAGPHGIVPSIEQPADLMIVFGAAEPDLAHEAVAAVKRGLVRRIIFSGGIGKDSGPLSKLGIPEAVFLASIAIAHNIAADRILVEPTASNGAENAAFSLRLAAERDLLGTGVRVCGLAPAVRSRRLYEELRLQGSRLAIEASIIGMIPAALSTFDGALASVQAEAAREIVGLHTMDQLTPPRILHQADFEVDGKYGDLVAWAISRT